MIYKKLSEDVYNIRYLTGKQTQAICYLITVTVGVLNREQNYDCCRKLFHESPKRHFVGLVETC